MLNMEMIGGLLSTLGDIGKIERPCLDLYEKLGRYEVKNIIVPSQGPLCYWHPGDVRRYRYQAAEVADRLQDAVDAIVECELVGVGSEVGRRVDEIATQLVNILRDASSLARWHLDLLAQMAAIGKFDPAVTEAMRAAANELADLCADMPASDEAIETTVEPLFPHSAGLAHHEPPAEPDPPGVVDDSPPGDPGGSPFARSEGGA